MEKYKGLIQFPESLWAKAQEIGRQQEAINKANPHLQAKEYDRGTRNEEVRVFGALCELVAMHFLHIKGLLFVRPPMVADKPIKGPDIFLNGKGYDVKGVRDESTYFMVNKKAHEKEKGIDFYWFVAILGKTTAMHWVFPKKEVDNWEIKFMGYTDAYCLPVASVPTTDEPTPEPQPEPAPVHKYQELIDYFEGVDIPEGVYQISKWEKIISIQVFLDSHLTAIKTGANTYTVRNCAERLESLRKLIDSGELEKLKA